MIWIKTDAGRAEMQARALVKERIQRTLLLLIDGAKSDEMLLSNLAGVSAADFEALQALGLITPVLPSNTRSGSAAAGRSTSGAASTSTSSAAPLDAAPLDYAQFTAALTGMISSELGLRGFVLTLAVEKAGTIEELQAVAQRTLAQIRERKGEAAAAAAQRTLYGG